MAVCSLRQPHSAGWAPAMGGLPLSVCIHIIMPEQYGPDPRYIRCVHVRHNLGHDGIGFIQHYDSRGSGYAVYPYRLGNAVFEQSGHGGRMVYIGIDYALEAAIMGDRSPPTRFLIGAGSNFSVS